MSSTFLFIFLTFNYQAVPRDCEEELEAPNCPLRLSDFPFEVTIYFNKWPRAFSCDWWLSYYGDRKKQVFDPFWN